MKLIKDHAVGIEAVLVRHVRRKHLVGAAGRQILDLLLRFQYLDPLGKRRTEPHHIYSYVKDYLSLVAVGGAAVDLGAFLVVPAGEEQRNGGGKFGFALFLRNLNVGGIELPVTVGF